MWRPWTRSSSGSRRENGRASRPDRGDHRIGPVPEAPPIVEGGYRRALGPRRRPGVRTDRNKGLDHDRRTRPLRRRGARASLSRRHFLRGLGASHRAAGLRVAGHASRCSPRKRRRQSGRDRHGRAVAGGLRLLPQRRHPGLLVAERRGDRLPAQAGPSSRWSRSRARSRSWAA